MLCTIDVLEDMRDVRNDAALRKKDGLRVVTFMNVKDIVKL
jgi:hypothetical protein